MLKKKLLCFLTAFSIILSAGIIPSYAEDNAEDDAPADKYYEKAKLVTDSLLNGAVIEAEEEAAVTRAQFVHAIVKLFDVPYTSDNETTYLDVDESNEYFSDINIARQMGWIASVDTFSPNEQIKLNEALKILLSAAGYTPLAINSGGYPQGYVHQASRIGLLDKLSMAEKLKVSDAYKMFYNLLEAKVLEEEIKINGASYSTGNDTYMYSIHNAYMFDGIVTGTSYSGFVSNYSIGDNKIEINGDKFSYKTTGLDMLGKSVEVLCREEDDERTVLVLIDKDNKETEIAFDDLKSIEDSRVSYFTSSDNSKTIRLEEGCDIIYNGRKCDALADAMTEGDGFIRLLDNDGDGRCEVMFVTKYKYGIVSSATVHDETAGIKTSGNSHMILNFADNERHYLVKKSDGSDGAFSDLKKDTAIRIALSEDMYLCNIDICDKSISGNIESLDESERKMTVDGTEYKISDYFIENEIKRAVVGKSISVYVSNDGYIISKCASITEYKYGYLIKLYRQEDTDRIFAKIFNDKGDFEEIELKSKGLIDGKASKRLDRQLLDELGERPEQLIRYKLNNEGLINAVDTAADVTKSTFGAGAKLPENDSLTRYFSGTMMFKEGVRGFAPYFSVERALIFKIPPEKANYEDYKVVSYSELGDDVNYPVSGYDLDENGYAAAAVIVADDYYAQPDKNTPSYVIEKVRTGINDDDEEILWIDCWYGGTYKKLFVDPSKVNVEKSSGKPLGTGDIVRIIIHNDEEIVSMSVDFDAAAFVPEKPSIFNIGNAELMYQAGKVYSVGENQMYMSSVKDGYDNYDFSYQNLRLYSIAAAGNNILLVNTDNRIVRPIKAEEIQSYVGYGSKGYYAVIRQFAFFPRIVVLYE